MVPRSFLRLANKPAWPAARVDARLLGIDARVCAKTLAPGRLVRILEDFTPPLTLLCLYYSNRRNPSAALQAFIALARDFAAGRLAQP